MEKLYGPVLPPKLESDAGSVSDHDDDSSNDDYRRQEIGPVLPPRLIKDRTESKSDDDDNDNEEDTDVTEIKATQDKSKQMYGPALPPGFSQQRNADSTVVGPLLPPGMTKTDLRSQYESDDDDDDDDDDDTSDVIGPMPLTTSDDVANEAVLHDIERRASKMKKHLTVGPDEELKREEWMTVLPPDLKKTFGVGPRSFLRQTPSEKGDRSIWTDTPSEREAKEKLSGNESDHKAQMSAPSFEDLQRGRYDQEMSRRVEEYCAEKGTRKESLLDTHTKNLKRKKKLEKQMPKERRPFDRDIDLKANQIDDAKRKALIKQSRHLNDKFSHGKGHFL